MNRPKEITATEKLLDVIKKKHDDPPPRLQPRETPPAGKKWSFKLGVPSIAKFSPGSSNIGVDIGNDCIRMVRASRTGGHWQVDELRETGIPAYLSKDGDEFAELLKTSLAAAGSSKNTGIWAIMSAEHVEIQNIRIPKLPHPQIANAVYWTLKKSVAFDEDEMTFDFEIQGEVIEQGIAKLAAVACIAPRREIDDIRALFAKIGSPLTGISIAPFAFQNLLRKGRVDVREKVIASLFVGNDFSRIDIYASGNLVMTRDIKAGNNSMIDALVDSYNDSRPGAPPLTFEQGKKILVDISSNSSPPSGPDAPFGLGAEEIFGMIQPSLERVARQVEMTFKYFAMEQEQGKIAKVLISGILGGYRPISDYIGSQLDIACDTLDPLGDEDTSFFCDNVKGGSCWPERLAFTPALGIAFSDNEYTPNFIFTFRDKEQEASIKKINRGVFFAFMVAVAVLGSFFFYQNNQIDRKRSIVAGMEKTLADIGPEVDQGKLLKMKVVINRQGNLSRLYADRYVGMAFIGELAALTPSNIHLVNMKIRLGPAPSGEASQAAGAGATGQQGRTVSLEGFLLGERQTLESSLAGYLMALEKSPLFSGVSVGKSNLESAGGNEALHFLLNLKAEARTNG